jgi:hypothetical protein
VAVRTLVHDSRRYCYLVNQQRQPAEVTLQADNPTGRATDLATGREVDAPSRWPIVLGPYELRSFGLAGNAKITGFSISPIAGRQRADGRPVGKPDPRLVTPITASR